MLLAMVVYTEDQWTDETAVKYEYVIIQEFLKYNMASEYTYRALKYLDFLFCGIEMVMRIYRYQ